MPYNGCVTKHGLAISKIYRHMHAFQKRFDEHGHPYGYSEQYLRVKVSKSIINVSQKCS